MQLLAARLVRVVEVADALDTRDPARACRRRTRIPWCWPRCTCVFGRLAYCSDSRCDFLRPAAAISSLRCSLVALDGGGPRRRVGLRGVGATVKSSGAVVSDLGVGVASRSRRAVFERHAARCPARPWATGSTTAATAAAARIACRRRCCWPGRGSRPCPAFLWLADCTRITSSEGRLRRGLLELEGEAEREHAVRDQREQQGDAEAIGAARAGCSRASRLRTCASMTSNSWPAMLSPNCASSSRTQVGDVTLISVR